MNVQELIEQLEDCDPDATVMMRNDPDGTFNVEVDDLEAGMELDDEAFVVLLP